MLDRPSSGGKRDDLARMEEVGRRDFLLVLLLAASVGAQNGKTSLRGKLVEGPKLELAGGKLVPLGGDEATMGVLRDKRLAGADFEVIGQPGPAGVFVVDPIHTKAMFVHKGGKKHLITYWCEMCAIRTYTPGICWCCQQETALDLREADEK